MGTESGAIRCRVLERSGDVEEHHWDWGRCWDAVVVVVVVVVVVGRGQTLLGRLRRAR